MRGTAANYRPFLWNCAEDVGIDRTNNRMEGYNSRLAKKVPTTHLNIFAFTDLIKSELAYHNIKLMQMDITGDVLPAKQTKYVEIDERIRRYQEELNSGRRSLF